MIRLVSILTLIFFLVLLSLAQVNASFNEFSYTMPSISSKPYVNLETLGYKKYSEKYVEKTSRYRVFGIYLGFGLGYENLNSPDLRLLKRGGLGDIRQCSGLVHGDVGAMLNLRYFMLSGTWTFSASGHTWKNCFGSGLDVDMYGRVTEFEFKVGPCIRSIFNLKNREKGEIVPFLLVGRTLKMSLKDTNKDGFVNGEGPLFLGGGIDYVAFVSEAAAVSVGLKYITRTGHCYKSFRVEDEFPLEVKTAPYSISLTLGIIGMPF